MVTYKMIGSEKKEKQPIFFLYQIEKNLQLCIRRDYFIYFFKQIPNMSTINNIFVAKDLKNKKKKNRKRLN